MSPTLISGATAVCTATVSLLHSIEWIDNDWRAHSPSTAFRSLSTRPCLCYPHFGGSFQPPTRREQPAGSSGGPDAAPVARGAGRAGRCPRPWPAAAARHRARHPVVPDPLGASWIGEDLSRPIDRRAYQGPLRALLGRHQRDPGAAPSGQDRRAASNREGPAHDPVRGRDPPFQQGPAGCLSAPRRVGYGDAHRLAYGETLLPN